MCTRRLDRQRLAIGDDRRARSESSLGLVRTDLYVEFTAYAMGATYSADYTLHVQRRLTQLGRSTSTKSMRAPPLPLTALTTLRIAVAVRPWRPITLPRSSGWTRTSYKRPLRSCLARTS